MKIILPMAGYGLRMRPHTNTKPKSLFKIADRTILDYFLESIKDLNVSEIIFITGHLKHMIEDYVKKNYSFKTRFIEQKSLNGTAGSIRLVKDYIDEPFMLVLLDGVFEVDLSIISNSNENLIWVKEVDDPKKFGVCIVENDYLKKIVEKPDEPVSNLACVGLYYIKDFETFLKGIEYTFEKDINIKGEYYATEAFSYMLQKNKLFKCPKVEGWYDFGNMDDSLESNRQILKKYANNPNMASCVIIPPVYISKDVIVKNSIIGPFVSIGKKTKIDSSIIKNSILGESLEINNSIMEKSIIGDFSSIIGSAKNLNLGENSIHK